MGWEPHYDSILALRSSLKVGWKNATPIYNLYTVCATIYTDVMKAINNAITAINNKGVLCVLQYNKTLSKWLYVIYRLSFSHIFFDVLEIWTGLLPLKARFFILKYITVNNLTAIPASKGLLVPWGKLGISPRILTKLSLSGVCGGGSEVMIVNDRAPWQTLSAALEAFQVNNNSLTASRPLQMPPCGCICGGGGFRSDKAVNVLEFWQCSPYPMNTL